MVPLFGFCVGVFCSGCEVRRPQYPHVRGAQGRSAAPWWIRRNPDPDLHLGEALPAPTRGEGHGGLILLILLPRADGLPLTDADAGRNQVEQFQTNSRPPVRSSRAKAAGYNVLANPRPRGDGLRRRTQDQRRNDPSCRFWSRHRSPGHTIRFVQRCRRRPSQHAKRYVPGVRGDRFCEE